MEMHQLVSRGFQLKKASFLVSRRFKESTHTIEEKNTSGKESVRLIRHWWRKEKLYWNQGWGEQREYCRLTPALARFTVRGRNKVIRIELHIPGWWKSCCSRRPIPKRTSGLRAGSGLSSAVPPNLIHSFRWKDFIDLCSILRWACLELHAINWWWINFPALCFVVCFFSYSSQSCV